MITEQEVESPVKPEESLDVLMKDLGICNLIHAWIYLIRVRRGRLDWTVKNYARRSLKIDLDPWFQLLSTKNGPDRNWDTKGTGPIQYPEFRALDERIYIFTAATYKEGHFYVEVHMEIPNSKPVRLGDFTVPALRTMLGVSYVPPQLPDPKIEHPKSWKTKLWEFLNKER